MKKRRQAQKKRRKVARSKITRLQASANGGQLPPDVVRDWPKYYKALKQPVTLRLDADVLAWFKRQGRGYQTRINRALRKVMAEERKS
ncbi:MAG: BrnA antitoxin family protein [Terriglobales bacterium]|jgi:uncharacterized protein (DUF4415 family)